MYEPTHENLHRTAKYFMDSGRANSADEALGILNRFGLYIAVGPEVSSSRDHQAALFSLVNVARRTFLGGVHVVAAPAAPVLTPLGTANDVRREIVALGGENVSRISNPWPVAVIGNASTEDMGVVSWRVTWEGWRGGVVPVKDGRRLSESWSVGVTPILAAAVCAAEVFMYHSGDHPLSGHRAAGMSLRDPGRDWLDADDSEAELRYLPSKLWLLGLGNLGQAYLWVLASLPYRDAGEVELMLQDHDRLAESNESTSVLTVRSAIGAMKTRTMADWLETRGFRVTVEERLFGSWSRRAPHEAGVVLCGLDNALARASLESANFGLVVDAGLGAGPNAFRNFSIHTFPGEVKAKELWGVSPGTTGIDVTDLVAYDTAKYPHLDECGRAQLASRTVGVPFVGVTAAVLVVSEILRRLNGGSAFSVVSGSLSDLDDLQTSTAEKKIYEFGHLSAAMLGESSRNDWATTLSNPGDVATTSETATI
ncbi:MAG: hypothetical protein WBO10_04040 [Pyrinomonadaceae bacterium]